MAEQEVERKIIAYIIDNEVVEILHTDERLSAIFLSNPVVKDITEQMSNPDENIWLGATYNPETDTYTNPAEIEDPYINEQQG